MHLFYWDTSALGKRFVPETGSAEVQQLFSLVSRNRMRALSLALGEITSVLVRRRNAGLISRNAYLNALVEFDREVAGSVDFELLPVSDALVRASVSLIPQHAINATDAMVLRSALGLANLLRPDGDDLVLIATDQRLLRAAVIDGLQCWNPETEPFSSVEAAI